MLNFREIVKNIALESEKVGYNPEIDTNWCHLPMEMRAECMTWMNFKDRCLLRRTSKVEKSLVDSKKYHFENVKVTLDFTNRKRVVIKGKDGTHHLEYYTNHKDTADKHLQCISEIFKKSVVESFEFDLENYHTRKQIPFWNELAKFAPFQIKRINVLFGDTAMFLLRNCANFERITLNRTHFSRFQVTELLTLPSVINAKELRIGQKQNNCFSTFPSELLQRWIDQNSEVGKSFQSSVQIEETVDLISAKFADRIIDKSENEVRIRMDNSTTQILIRCVGCIYRNMFISCKVIPIDQPESEYGIGDEWIEWEYRSRFYLPSGVKNPYNDI